MIKKLYERMVLAEQIADITERIYNADCENEEKEKMFDEAYKHQFECTEELIKELCKYGYDAKTWRKVLMTKREQIEALMKKTA